MTTEGTPVKEFGDLYTAAEEAVDLFGKGPGAIWFRGQAKASWPLLPSILRNHAEDKRWEPMPPSERRFDHWEEVNMARRFKLYAMSRLDRWPQGEAGWLALMRHFGLPTRLLDWTESILAAAFFAVGYEPREDDAAIWALSPSALNQKFDAKTSGDLALQSRMYELSSPRAEELVKLAFFHPRPTRPEILAVVPEQIDPRMMLQQSAFTIHGTGEALDELDGAEGFLMKFEIPKRQGKQIAYALERVGISQASMFPDLSHLAAKLTDDILRPRVRSARQSPPGSDAGI